MINEQPRKTSNTTIQATQAIDAGMAAESVSYAPTKPQANITALTDAHIATEKDRPNIRVITMINDSKRTIREEQEKLTKVEGQRAVELTLEKDAHTEWRARQEEQILALRSAMSGRDREHDETVRTINGRADKDAAGHNEIIARHKSFISGGVVSEDE